MTEDRRQLMQTFLDGGSVPRVPVGFWWHYYTTPRLMQAAQSRMSGPSKVPPSVVWRIMPNNPFRGYVDRKILRTNVEGHKRDFRALRPDFVKIMSDGFFSHPAILDNNVSGPDDLHLITPLTPDHPWITRQVELVDELTDYYDGEVMAFYNVFAPIQQLRLFIEYIVKDVDGFQDMLVTHADEVARVAEIIADDTLLLIEALKTKTAVDGIYYSVQSAQRAEADRAHHDRYIKPSDMRVLNRINELWKDNILHICGYEHYKNDLPYYAQYPASAYNWAVHTEGVSLAEGKQLFDGVVIGGFDNNPGSLIDAGTTAEVVAETEALIAEAGRDRLALGADCTIPRPKSLDRIEVIRRVAAQA